MLAIRITALVLIVASAVGLAVFSGFEEMGTVPSRMASAGAGIDIPMWICASGLFLGGLMLIGLATRR
jgi:hypothetical protein